MIYMQAYKKELYLILNYIGILIEVRYAGIQDSVQSGCKWL